MKIFKFIQTISSIAALAIKENDWQLSGLYIFVPKNWGGCGINMGLHPLETNIDLAIEKILGKNCAPEFISNQKNQHVRWSNGDGDFIRITASEKPFRPVDCTPAESNWETGFYKVSALQALAAFLLVLDEPDLDKIWVSEKAPKRFKNVAEMDNRYPLHGNVGRVLKTLKHKEGALLRETKPFDCTLSTPSGDLLIYGERE